MVHFIYIIIRKKLGITLKDNLADNETYNMIQKIFLFQGTDQSLFEKAISCDGFYINRYMSGDIIYEPKKFKHSLGVILCGSAKIATASDSKNVLLRTINTGCVFGAASLFGDEAEYVTQITAKGTTSAAFFSQLCIMEIITTDNRAAINYINFLSDRIRFLNSKIVSFTSGSAESRLARYIDSLPETDGTVTLPFGLNQLADSLDIGRASLYRALDNLELNGCIKRDGKKIIILSRKLLIG